VLFENNEREWEFLEGFIYILTEELFIWEYYINIYYYMATTQLSIQTSIIA
jgi:hypothetical protein